MFYCVEIYGNISTFGCLYFSKKSVNLYLWFLSFPSGSIGYPEEHSICWGLYSSPSAVPRSYHLLLSLFQRFFPSATGFPLSCLLRVPLMSLLINDSMRLLKDCPSHHHFLLWISRPILSCLMTSNCSWDMLRRFVLQVWMAYRRIDSKLELNILIFVYF